MQLSERLRIVLAGLAGIALVAVTVMAAQGTGPQDIVQTDPASVAVEHEQDCTGECATCPYAGTDTCPHATADDSASDSVPDATVDTERCIGCARCVNVAPEAFRMNPETRKAEIIEGAPASAIACGAKACPVDAINTE
ncbi:MAG: ferredoxin [Armatimonadota bacterium]